PPARRIVPVEARLRAMHRRMDEPRSAVREGFPWDRRPVLPGPPRAGARRRILDRSRSGGAARTADVRGTAAARLGAQALPAQARRRSQARPRSRHARRHSPPAARRSRARGNPLSWIERYWVPAYARTTELATRPSGGRADGSYEHPSRCAPFPPSGSNERLG